MILKEKLAQASGGNLKASQQVSGFMSMITISSALITETYGYSLTAYGLIFALVVQARDQSKKRGNRLSIMPVNKKQWDIILRME